MNSQQHGIDAYFTTAEFAEFSEYEKLRMRNMKLNYEKMIEVGLDVPPPDFMRRPAGVTRRKPRIKDEDSDDDEDESWVPGRSTGRKRIPTFKVPLKKPKVPKRKKEKLHTTFTPILDESDAAFESLANIDISQIEFDGVDTSDEANNRQEMESPKQKRKRTSKASKDASSEKKTRRYPVREGTRKCYRDLEAPDDDVYVYCEDCHELYEDNCPTHPLTIIEDSVVPSKCKKRARQSLPTGLVIKEAGIEGAGQGVWAEKFLPKGVRFGPYGGEIVDEEVGRESGYAWEIFRDKKRIHYINGKNEQKANWMRYVNCARNESEQNLVAYQYRGQIYYRSFKPIQPGTELLVFYGEEYAKELGIEEDKFLDDGSRHECQICGSVFTGKLFLLKHLKYRHHQHVDLTLYVSRNSPANRSLCKIASGKDKANQRLDYSVRIEHTGDNSHSTGIRTHDTGIEQRNSIGKLYQYKKCVRNFKQMVGVKKHEKDCTDNNSSYVCKKLSSAANLTLADREVTHVQKLCKCMHCNTVFTHKRNLVKHKVLCAGGQEKYKCRKCHKVFTQKSSLKTHEITHTGEKPYRCKQCNKGFTLNGNLKRHEMLHRGDKPHKCSHCVKTFTQSCNLKRHEQMHTGVKPYTCKYCPKAFTDSSHIKTHEQMHTGVKPYTCRYCPKAFTQSSHLKTHEQIHTGEKPYTCRYCPKAFTQSSHLKTHEQIHTGEKPYTCRYCPKAFTSSSYLKTHERIHTGEKPYQCKHCVKAFTDGSNLRQHERRTHKTPQLS